MLQVERKSCGARKFRGSVLTLAVPSALVIPPRWNGWSGLAGASGLTRASGLANTVRLLDVSKWAKASGLTRTSGLAVGAPLIVTLGVKMCRRYNGGRTCRFKRLGRIQSNE